MRFTPNHDGVGEILTGAPMLAEVGSIAEKVKGIAETIAPVKTGEYKDSFEVVTEIRDIHGERAVASVRNNSGHALDVEFGSGNTPRHRTLGRALGSA